MKCPRCEEGTIKKILVKENNCEGFLCEFCSTLWLGDENISRHSGHPYDAVNKGGVLEYSLEEVEELDQEHRSAKFSDIR